MNVHRPLPSALSVTVVTVNSFVVRLEPRRVGDLTTPEEAGDHPLDPIIASNDNHQGRVTQTRL